MRPLALALALLQLVTACAAFAEDGDPAGPAPRPHIYGVLVAGAATLASGITAFLFHRAGGDAYAKYQDAATYADAQKYRNDTEKFDRWRNIAVGTTGVALVVAGYAFWRYRADTHCYQEIQLRSMRESPAAREMQVWSDPFARERRTPAAEFAPDRTPLPSLRHRMLAFLRAEASMPAPHRAGAVPLLDGHPARLPWRGDDRIARHGPARVNRARARASR